MPICPVTQITEAMIRREVYYPHVEVRLAGRVGLDRLISCSWPRGLIEQRDTVSLWGSVQPAPLTYS